MKPRVALSITEMRALQRKGIDTSDASMCWIKEPNGEGYKMTVHDEYCYEMACLDPIPAYTLEDIILKLDAEVSSLPREVVIDMLDFAHKPWIVSVCNIQNINLPESIRLFGCSPLDAAFAVLCSAQDLNPKSISKLNED